MVISHHVQWKYNPHQVIEQINVALVSLVGIAAYSDRLRSLSPLQCLPVCILHSIEKSTMCKFGLYNEYLNIYKLCIRMACSAECLRLLAVSIWLTVCGWPFLHVHQSHIFGMENAPSLQKWWIFSLLVVYLIMGFECFPSTADMHDIAFDIFTESTWRRITDGDCV